MKIFLSHRSRDKATVREFASRLPSFLRAWLDEETLVWGESLSEQIQAAISSEVDFVLVFLGDDTLASEWVERELGWALKREHLLGRTFVLPVILGKIAIELLPPTLSNRVLLRLPDFSSSSIERLAHEASESVFQLLARGWGNRSSDAPKAHPVDLVDHLAAVGARCWNSPHLHQYHVTTILRPHPAGGHLLIEDTTITFQIRIGHLNVSELAYEHRFQSEVTLPGGLKHPVDDILMDYTATIGSSSFGLSDVETSVIKSAGRDTARFELFRCHTVTDGTKVMIRHRLAIRGDNRSISVVTRFPIRGFNFTLSHSDKYDFEFVWFKTTSPGAKDFPGHDEYTVLADGIAAQTYGWLLPGEGVCVMWEPRDTP